MKAPRLSRFRTVQRPNEIHGVSSRVMNWPTRSWQAACRVPARRKRRWITSATLPSGAGSQATNASQATAIWNTLWFVAFNVIATLLVALITALILNRAIAARGFFRAMFFYPVLLSPVVIGLIWKWFLDRNGLLNAFFQMLGVPPEIFLLDVGWSRFFVVVVSVWFHMGFYTLILLAGLQAIPKDLYEAAAIDAASPRRTLFRITLPLLGPNLLAVLILLMIRSVQIFDEAWVLTNGGGPGTANTFVVQYIYQMAFGSDLRLFGLASAASVLMGLVLLALTLVQLRLGKKMEF